MSPLIPVAVAVGLYFLLRGSMRSAFSKPALPKDLVSTFYLPIDRNDPAAVALRAKFPSTAVAPDPATVLPVGRKVGVVLALHQPPEAGATEPMRLPFQILIEGSVETVPTPDVALYNVSHDATIASTDPGMPIPKSGEGFVVKPTEIAYVLP